MIGYHSDMMWIPEANVGAVILTNGDLGPMIRGPFQRKLLEVLFDGKPEADENVAQRREELLRVARRRAQAADGAGGSGRGRASSPSTTRTTRSARSRVTHTTGGKTIFDFGEFKSEVAIAARTPTARSRSRRSRRARGFGELVAGTDGDKPTLTMRDGQHEYVFSAVK